MLAKDHGKFQHEKQNYSDRKTRPSRALDAFSIARDEMLEIPNLRQSRLGDFVPDRALKRKGGPYDEHKEVLDSSRTKKSRLKDKAEYIEDPDDGSDSEGNTWVTGTVAVDDDSSVDSDEAWASGDDETFSTFKLARISMAKNPRVGVHSRVSLLSQEANDIKIDRSESSAEEPGSDDESDGFAADAVDLVTMLDDASDEELQVAAVNGKDQLSTDVSLAGIRDNGQEAGYISDMSVSTDEDEDWDEKLDALHSLVTSYNGQGNIAQTQKTGFDKVQEAVSPASHGIMPKTKLTVSDLLSTVSDPALRSSLKIMASQSRKSDVSKGMPGKLSVPLSKRQQDRIDRVAAFTKSKETLEKWVDTVKHNRRAEHISFPLLDREAEAAKGSKRMLPITDSRRVTDLESTIHQLLVESGLADHQKNPGEKIQEFEELAAKAMPVEEVEARRAELRRNRELLFREEVRAKRIKKIKSKTHRKVHRKERERNLLRDKEALIAAGAIDPEDEQERFDKQRAEERMGRRHRENRWVKSLKSTGRAAWDEDAREGVNEMLRKDEELRRHVQGKDVRRDESVGSDSGSTPEEESENEDSFVARMKSKLESLDQNDNKPQTRLSSLKFMQRAEATHRAQNDEALAHLRRELNGEDLEHDSSNELQEQGRRSYGSHKMTTQISGPIVNGDFNDFEEPEGSDYEVDVGHNEDEADGFETDIVVDRYIPQTTMPGNTTKVQRPASALLPPKLKAEESVNPWSIMSKTASKMKPINKDTPVIQTVPQQQLESVPDTLVPVDKRTATATSSDTEPDSDDSFAGFSPPQSPHPTMDQKSLIQQAFAGDDVIAEETFLAEKTALAAEEEPLKFVPNTLPGWGTWVGPGLSKKEKREAKRAPTANGASSGDGRLAKTSEGVPAVRRRDRKLQKVIISEKRLPKTAKFLASELPHPFETRAQYERSLRLPMGPEFTTKETFQDMTKPRVLIKPGVIAPMRRPLV